MALPRPKGNAWGVPNVSPLDADMEAAIAASLLDLRKSSSINGGFYSKNATFSTCFETTPSWGGAFSLWVVPFHTKCLLSSPLGGGE